MSRIVVVDDAADVRLLIRAVLELGGHEVVDRADATELDLVATDARADAIILDLLLPGHAGWDAFVKMRSMLRLARTPVLFTSDGALPLPVSFAELRHWRAGYLAKPFGARDLLDAIDGLLGVQVRVAS